MNRGSNWVDSVSWVKGSHVSQIRLRWQLPAELGEFPRFRSRSDVDTGYYVHGELRQFQLNFGANYPTAGTGLNTAAGECAVPQDNGVAFTYSGCAASSGPKRVLSCSLHPDCHHGQSAEWSRFPNSTWATAYPPSSSMVQPANRPWLLGSLYTRPMADHSQANPELWPALGLRIRLGELCKQGFNGVAAASWTCLFAGYQDCNSRWISEYFLTAKT